MAQAGLPGPCWTEGGLAGLAVVKQLSPPRLPSQPDAVAQLWLRGGIAAHSFSLLPAGCNKLTDQALLYLRRISNVTLIDLRGCKQITRKACEHFISDLSINSLYCLSDEKLIQKIS